MKLDSVRQDISYDDLMMSEEILKIKTECARESDYILYCRIYEKLQQWANNPNVDLSQKACYLYTRRAKDEIYSGKFRMTVHVDKKEELEELSIVD